MNDLFILAIILVGLYLGWKILVASVKGIGMAGEKIKDDGPEFMSKVFVSVASGVIGGIIVAFTMGEGLDFAGPTAVGITVVAFLGQTFSS